jgi:beta-glucosidase
VNRRKFLLMMLVTVLFLALAGPHFGIATAEKPRPQPPYMDPSLPVEKRVKDLLRRMTLEEKVGQMTQINVTRLMGEDEWDRGPLNEEWMKKVLVDNRVGSILSGGGAAPVPNNPKA